MNKSTSNSGFTLMEILIATTLSFILVVGILRLYQSTVTSYNAQDNITEMNKNASYACKRISDEIMQAGVYLPDNGYVVIERKSSRPDSFLIRSNQFSALEEFVIDVASTMDIPVTNANYFRGTDDLVKLETNNILSYPELNTTYNTAPYTDGIDTASSPDRIRLKNNNSFIHGDILFASKELRFYKKGLNICFNTDDNVLAENIDSLSVLFYAKSKDTTSLWTNMLYASIYVRARSALPDNKYVHPQKGDHYRRYEQNMDVLIRKKPTF